MCFCESVNMRETMMTERELRLCVEGTISEAERQLGQVATNWGADRMIERIDAAIAELQRAKAYAVELGKNT